MCSYYKKQDNKTMQWCLLTTPPHHVVVFTFHHRILTGSIFTQYRNSFLVGDVEKFISPQHCNSPLHLKKMIFTQYRNFDLVVLKS